MILGLEEGLQGTVADFVNSRGLITLGFEGGQHLEVVAEDDPVAAHSCSPASASSAARARARARRCIQSSKITAAAA